MAKPAPDPSSEAFLIETTIRETDPIDPAEVCAAICRLGGVKTKAGYAFPSARSRAVAMELLGDKFGTRYVAMVDGEPERETS